MVGVYVMSGFVLIVWVVAHHMLAALRTQARIDADAAGKVVENMDTLMHRQEKLHEEVVRTLQENNQTMAEVLKVTLKAPPTFSADVNK